MKYWNKQKDVRQRCWTKLKIKGSYNDERWRIPIFLHDIKFSLQQCSSRGKFFMDHYSREIWFQDGKDATWFALKYSEILA